MYYGIHFILIVKWSSFKVLQAVGEIETRMISFSAKTRFVSPFESTYSTPTARCPSKMMRVTKTFDVTFKLDLKNKN